MTPLKDTYSDKKIKVCIRNSRSFAVVAGAGSGKTTSLIKALDFVRSSHGKTLRVHGKRIACITFTNRAVDVIKARLNSDDLFAVSTLHSFLWGEIKKFQSDIRKTLREEILPRRIEKKQAEDNGGQSKAAKTTRKMVIDLQDNLKNIEQVPDFNYEESGRNYASGKLDHDDIVDLAAAMIRRIEVLRKIIAQRYPYIFIDEAQDTFPEIVDALNLLASGATPATVGYFGDPMQQIYDNRAGDFRGPSGSAVITKKENYRCSIEVIKLLNSFRTDITQTPSANNYQGSVQIRLIKREEGQGYRKSYSDQQLDRVLREFDSAMEHFGWKDDPEVKRLFLARQMIARRLGFSELNHLFTGTYASRNAEDDYQSGEHYLLTPFIRVLAPLVEAHAGSDKAKVFNILREYSPLLKTKGESQFSKIQDVVTKGQKAVETFVAAWAKENTKNLLKLAVELKLIQPPDRLAQQLAREKRTEEFDEEIHSKEKGDWLADLYFDFTSSEIPEYVKFVQAETPFSTQHGVKGEEYQKVLVLYDDTEAGWHNYSFSKLLSPVASGKEPTEGQKIRSQKLAYVSFSRAEKDLKIILFTLDPMRTNNELIEQGLFRQEQISIQTSPSIP